MAFNGSGTFVRLYNWVQDKANNIKILAARMDAEMDGFATGLSTCITKDGQTTPTADLTLGNFKFTNAGKATGYNQYMTAEQVIENEFVYYTTSGTDTYTITPSPSITAYTAGLGLKIKIGTTNTTTATLNVNALGAKTIKTPSGAALTAGELPAGAIVDLVYDGTDFVISQYQSKVAAFTSGAIDGTVIGGTTRAAISATTGNFNALVTATAGINPNSSGGVTWNLYDNKVSWTPVLAVGGVDIGSGNYSTQFASYSRNGYRIDFNIRLQWTSLGGQTGAATITGFPITGAGQSYRAGGVCSYWNGIAVAAGTLPGFRLDSTTITLTQLGVITATTAMTDVELTAAGELYIQGWIIASTGT